MPGGATRPLDITKLKTKRGRELDGLGHIHDPTGTLALGQVSAKGAYEPSTASNVPHTRRGNEAPETRARLGVAIANGTKDPGTDIAYALYVRCSIEESGQGVAEQAKPNRRRDVETPHGTGIAEGARSLFVGNPRVA
jgi:hypothetical protein